MTKNQFYTYEPQSIRLPYLTTHVHGLFLILLLKMTKSKTCSKHYNHVREITWMMIWQQLAILVNC